MTPFADLLQQGATAAWFFIPSAILLGALHGLEPGHSKTMMAAFIVAIRGTFLQAALLAFTATISHTAIVWLVALLALTYGNQWSAETTEPYFQMASAVIIIGVALWMVARTYRGQRAAKTAAAHAHDHAHDETKIMDIGHGLVELSVFEQGVSPRLRVRFKDRFGTIVPPPTGEVVTVETRRESGARETFALERAAGDFLEATRVLPEPHQFAAVLSIAHGGHAHTYETRFVEHGPGHHYHHADLDAGSANYEDAHERAHADDMRRRFANRKVTTGQIALFGLTGGLLPCPAAVTVLLLCLQLKEFWLGIVLVLCFSIGLALTLLASGTIASWGVRHVSRRWSGFDRWARRLPYFSSAIVICVGLYVGYMGLAGLL